MFTNDTIKAKNSQEYKFNSSSQTLQAKVSLTREPLGQTPHSLQVLFSSKVRPQKTPGQRSRLIIYI